MQSKHFIGIHGYMLVYSVGSKTSFEMVKVIRDKILNHLVRYPLITHSRFASHLMTVGELKGETKRKC